MKSNINRKKENGSGSNAVSRSSSEASGSSYFYESEEAKKVFRDRTNYLLVNSIGSAVTVTVSSGVRYSGLLLAATSTFDGISIVLKFPAVIDKGIEDGERVAAEKLPESLLIDGADVSELELKDVDFSLDEKWDQKKRQAENKNKIEVERKSGFRTDADISGANSDVRERELKKWAPEEFENFEIGESLEENAGTWDQFAVNEQKFGITSTFDEHLYTTKINKGDPNYEDRLKEADRIAKEIESQGTSGNVHLREERGIIVDDSGMDEEDKYSGVDRRGDELLAQLKLNAKPVTDKPSKYIPPSLRHEPQNTDPAVLSSIKKGRQSPSSKSPVEKRAPQEEHKKVLEKPKAPPKALEKPKPASKKPEEPKVHILPKGSPSLPPKPVPKTNPPGSSGIEPQSLKAASKSSKPSTPAAPKADLRRNSLKFVSQGIHTPASSPSSGRASTYRRRNNASFFSEENRKSKKKDFTTAFNVFLQAKKAYDVKAKALKNSENKVLEPFFIERPYFTTPTWMSTMEKSYTYLFPDERTAIKKAHMRLQQRTMHSMSANMPMGTIPGAMTMPAGPGCTQATPFMASPGMFMSFQPQPMFYPPVPQLVAMMDAPGDDRRNSTHSPSPGANSSHASPTFINGAAPMGPFGYPACFRPMMAHMGTAHNNNPDPNGSSSNYKSHYHSQDNGNRFYRNV